MLRQRDRMAQISIKFVQNEQIKRVLAYVCMRVCVCVFVQVAYQNVRTR